MISDSDYRSIDQEESGTTSTYRSSWSFNAHGFKNTPKRIRSCLLQLSQYISRPLSAKRVVGSDTLPGLTKVIDAIGEAPRAALD